MNCRPRQDSFRRLDAGTGWEVEGAAGLAGFDRAPGLQLGPPVDFPGAVHVADLYSCLSPASVAVDPSGGVFSASPTGLRMLEVRHLPLDRVGPARRVSLGLCPELGRWAAGHCRRRSRASGPAAVGDAAAGGAAGGPRRPGRGPSPHGGADPVVAAGRRRREPAGGRTGRHGRPGACPALPSGGRGRGRTRHGVRVPGRRAPTGAAPRCPYRTRLAPLAAARSRHSRDQPGAMARAVLLSAAGVPPRGGG